MCAGGVSVSSPPEIDPIVVHLNIRSSAHRGVGAIRIYLVVCNQDHARCEVTLELSVWELANLSGHTLIAAHMHFR